MKGCGSISPRTGHLKRGVYLLPLKGTRGQLYLVAITAKGTLAGKPFVIPVGDTSSKQNRAAWRLLDRADPKPPYGEDRRSGKERRASLERRRAVRKRTA
jgi:hypothetical protein